VARIPRTERISTSGGRSWLTAAALLVVTMLAVAPAAMAATTGAVGGVRDPAAGPLGLTVQASENGGAGLRSAAVTLGGELLDVAPFDDPACTAGTCPAVGSVTLLAPTTGVPDGPQRLEVTVEDGNGDMVHVLDRTVTVANDQPPYSSTVTLTIGSNPATGPSGATQDPPGGAGAQQSGCQAPRLSVVLARRPARVRRGLPLLTAGKRHRFLGRLTCLAGTRRVNASAGTPIGLRHWVGGRIELQRVVRVGTRGRFAVRARVPSRRVLAFRARSATGNVVRVRIRVGVIRGRT
jgi:hypothetical protein